MLSSRGSQRDGHNLETEEVIGTLLKEDNGDSRS